MHRTAQRVISFEFVEAAQEPVPTGTQSQVTPAHTTQLGWYLEFESRVTHRWLSSPTQRGARCGM